MNKAKKVFYTIGTGIAAGMVLGVLFAPDKGCATRDKIRRLRASCACCGKEEEDKRTLEELSEVLKKELALVNEKIEKLS